MHSSLPFFSQREDLLIHSDKKKHSGTISSLKAPTRSNTFSQLELLLLDLGADEYLFYFQEEASRSLSFDTRRKRKEKNF